ncbi:DUF885 domain-containing protein [Arthrobacter sp. UM1]|uniref:DUF885 domain-containing protein n=1 Tax=Arthrobacter sp. UM1 TaxID=2766776 RepID=UPI001CF62719|nr:DUF885 domain-containing protein [Arthrobacter sp. UM1]MCB4208019.1 DUF885 domain-containing protein [Arthrobacter sp. UM1]
MSSTTPETPRRTPTEIDQAAEDYAAEAIALDPTLATMLGVPGRETEFPDYSPAGIEEGAALARRTLARLAALTPQDETDAVTLDAMRERLGLALECVEALDEHAMLNNIASPAQDIRAVFDLMPQESREDFERIAGRMENVSGAVAGYIESLRCAAERGVVAARRQVETVIEQCSAYGAADGFFTQLAAAGEERHPALAKRLNEAAAQANVAYSKLAGFLRSELWDEAPEKDAVGRERYARASRSFLGEAVDLEETYAWGLEELASIVAEQEALAERIRPGASVAEAKRVLNEDPARQLHGTDALREWMQGISDRAVEELGREQFDIPEPLRTLECRIAPTQDGGIYYTGPSSDFSRPGRMWWSVPPGEESFTTWSTTSTVYHEGVPGHHLQVGTATFLKDALNAWRRDLCWTSGHGEGWALYAERLMQELGFLSDPGDAMGMLDAQRMRAARVVFDIGVHLELEMPAEWQKRTGETRWTPDAGKAFLDEHLDLSEGQRSFEYLRYLGWPGQAPSYKVGQRIWEQLRDEAASRSEEPLDVKAWHARALGLGSLPLSTLVKAMRGELTA